MSVRFIRTQWPYLAMILLHLLISGSTLLTKIAFNHGMHPSVFLFYRLAFSVPVMVPLAYYLERDTPSLSSELLWKTFMVSLFGLTVCLNLFTFALKITSATIATALVNTVPAATFIIAVILRIENVLLHHVAGVAKLLGTFTSLGGALLLAFYEGPLVGWDNAAEKDVHVQPMGRNKRSSVLGVLLIAVSQFAWSLWVILQGIILKKYPSKLRLNLLQCFLCFIQTTPIAFVSERNLHSWKLGWDFNLLAVIYTAVATNGVSYWLQLCTLEKRGPIFVAAFTPLQLTFASVFSAIVWKERLHWGSVIAYVLLIIGLSCVLWGKNKEEKLNALEGKNDHMDDTSSHEQNMRDVV